MKNIIILIYVFTGITLLSSCATVRESYSPDGRKAYSLNCSGLARGWDKCLSSAGEICKSSGYDILDRTSEEKSSASASFNQNGGYAQSAKTHERTMLIACKKK